MRLRLKNETNRLKPTSRREQIRNVDNRLRHPPWRPPLADRRMPPYQRLRLPRREDRFRCCIA